MNFPIGYGINQDQAEQASTETEAQETPAEAVVCPVPKRKRARVNGGQFAADDPTTAVNEAWSES